MRLAIRRVVLPLIVSALLSAPFARAAFADTRLSGAHRVDPCVRYASWNESTWSGGGNDPGLYQSVADDALACALSFQFGPATESDQCRWKLKSARAYEKAAALSSSRKSYPSVVGLFWGQAYSMYLQASISCELAKLKSENSEADAGYKRSRVNFPIPIAEGELPN